MKHYSSICSAQITVINERFDVFIELLAMTIFSPPSTALKYFSLKSPAGGLVICQKKRES